MSVSRDVTVVLLSSFVPPTIGGIATVLSSLILEFDKFGLKVVVVGPTEPPTAPTSQNVIWVPTPHLVAGRHAWQKYVSREIPSWEQAQWEMKRAATLLAKQLMPLRPTIVHSHSDWFLGGTVAELLGIPHIATLHGYPPNPEDFEEERLPYNHRIDRVRDEVRYTKCSAFTAVSHYVKNRWVSAGIDEQRISVIYNPIRFDLFQPQPSHVRKMVRGELGISDDVKIVCYPQRSDKFGVRTLIEALALIRRKREDVMLMLCGGDQLPLLVEHLIAELGIRDAVTVRGFELEDMVGVYAACDVVVLPNPIEPFGLPAIEAIATGVPVVACDSGAYAELLHDGQLSSLFRPRDVFDLAQCIAAAIDRRMSRTDVASLTGPELRMFDQGAVAARYLDLYDAVLDPQAS